ncbi:MAG TPA: cellulase family glycosylhydrolase [Acidimicrobiales bacterium]|nr:cellulase family glycosylhydrolase [Acidimicrobiales bacterium]
MVVGLGAVIASSPSPVAAAPLSVSVVGNHLVDGSGNPLVLRGADLSGTEFSCIQNGTPTSRGWSIYGGQPLDQPSTYAAMAAWHINAVRVPLNEDCWLGINGVNPAYGGSNYQNAIATEVAQINAAGMVAILDLHWSNPGTYAALSQEEMADADHSITFWSQVASAYKSNHAVIFDLFNEPYFYWISDGTPPWSCWLNGCQQNQVVTAGQTLPDGTTTGYQTSYTWQSAGMQQLLDAVRATGATNPVLINGLGWANDDTGWGANAPSDPANQLIVGAHMYPGAVTCLAPSCPSIETLAATHPVVIGETGDSSAAPATYLPTFLPWADAHGLSYLAWTWNPWGNADDVLIQDWSGTPTTGEGAVYQAHLAALASSGGTTTTGSPPTTTTTARAGTGVRGPATGSVLPKNAGGRSGAATSTTDDGATSMDRSTGAGNGTRSAGKAASEAAPALRGAADGWGNVVVAALSLCVAATWLVAMRRRRRGGGPRLPAPRDDG